ncbi:cupin domain-containing protein [Chloroflexota bacterium]
MFFNFAQDFKTRNPEPGITQYIVWGNNSMLVYAYFEENVSIPLHNHPNEQILTVISGELSFTLGDETRLMKPNDAVLVLPDIRHSAKSGPGGCVTVEVFCPPREDFRTE